MTLSFSKYLNNKPTYFVEKIWAGLLPEYRGAIIALQPDYLKATPNDPKIRMFGMLKPKIHTLREDPSNRWKKDNKIHFVINNRTPYRFQFAPTIPCTNIQSVLIDKHYGTPQIYIDEVLLRGDENYLQFANNDGFDSVEEFYDCFRIGWEGKLIGWTNHKYNQNV